MAKGFFHHTECNQAKRESRDPFLIVRPRSTLATSHAPPTGSPPLEPPTRPQDSFERTKDNPVKEQADGHDDQHGGHNQ